MVFHLSGLTVLLSLLTTTSTVLSIPSDISFTNPPTNNNPSLTGIGKGVSKPHNIEGAFIVELETDSKGLKKRGLENVEQTHDAFYKELEKRKMPYEVRKEFNSNPSLFHGASLNLDLNSPLISSLYKQSKQQHPSSSSSEDDTHSKSDPSNDDEDTTTTISSFSLGLIKSLPGVQNVWPVGVYQTLGRQTPMEERFRMEKRNGELSKKNEGEDNGEEKEDIAELELESEGREIEVEVEKEGDEIEAEIEAEGKEEEEEEKRNMRRELLDLDLEMGSGYGGMMMMERDDGGIVGTLMDKVGGIVDDNRGGRMRQKQKQKMTRRGKKYPNISEEEFKNDTFEPHVMIKVDKLHEIGILGKGIKIAVIDSGVDYKHPALGGCFGDGCKISFGYDLVGDDFTGFNTPVPDKDPYDPCGEHGTHVSGIIGADPNEFNFTGVAPHAELGMYRVFGCAGTNTPDDVIIDAMMAAYKDKADIITLSIGGANGWTENAGSVLADRLNRKGTVVTISAGNDGTQGLFYPSSPAASLNTWSIGSVEVDTLPIVRNGKTNTGKEITYYSLFPLGVEDMPIYVIPSANESCSPLPASTPNLTDFVVVIKRGGCLIDDKYSNAAAAGARYVLIANTNDAPFYSDGTSKNLTAAALIDSDSGNYLIDQAAAGNNITVTLNDKAFHQEVNKPFGGYLNSFSTWGPTFDMVGQPTVSGPGGNILSTFPLRLRGYGIISGTSMACPAVAGSVALYLSAPGSKFPPSQSMRDIFTTTGQLLETSANQSGLAPAVHQGGGLVNVWAALHEKSLISPSQLMLNDTKHFRSSHEITINNYDSLSKDYKVSHLPAYTGYTFDNGSSYPSPNPELVTSHASVQFSRTSFTVPPFGKVILKVTFTAPELDTKRFGVYSGFVRLETGDDVRAVPYNGLAATLHDVKIVDSGSEWTSGVIMPAIATTNDSKPTTYQQGAQTYSFKGKDQPQLVLSLLMGSPKATTDLVASDIEYSPTIQDVYDTTKVPAKTYKTYSSVPIIGNIPSLSDVYFPRSISGAPFLLPWNGSYVDQQGTSKTVANGEYRWLVRALKINGNPTLESEYESWLSPIIGVQH